MAGDIYQKIVFTSFNSIIGKIFIAATSKGICRLIINGSLEDFKKELKESQRLSVVRNDAVMEPVAGAIKQYLKGVCVDFMKFRICPQGSSFQKEVWNALLKIPYGRTVSYKDVAQMINRPNASRAVGNVCGKNPIPIIIPCHRVIASDKGLGGYSSGLEIKKKLLELELLSCR
ncbi:MAG: methylated-DNA--[protein]-cysteine S-methyltransferase [Deltaproteobacteria bacterium]|nr:methylated-DNA--[protein]-cysteine S-methyltransferase [Deltaproteobacteria bacterium]MBI5893190.1 methylated-DNA--[protein]-cysteine S-methyltransferase [Deltaproteobacteria bacterium]